MRVSPLSLQLGRQQTLANTRIATLQLWRYGWRLEEVDRCSNGYESVSFSYSHFVFAFSPRLLSWLFYALSRHLVRRSFWRSGTSLLASRYEPNEETRNWFLCYSNFVVLRYTIYKDQYAQILHNSKSFATDCLKVMLYVQHHSPRLRGALSFCLKFHKLPSLLCLTYRTFANDSFVYRSTMVWVWRCSKPQRDRNTVH